MAKKFKFTDLAYDDVKSNSEKEEIKNESYLQDLKNNSKQKSANVSDVIFQNTKTVVVNKNNDFESNNSGSKQENILESISKENKKINYEIDYSEYEDGDNSKKTSSNFSKINDEVKVQPEFNFKKTQLKTYSSVLNGENLNERIGERYNESSYRQENLSGTMGSTFSPSKIKDLISFKEKLDVKTNIYLKSSVVVKLKELEKRTNESRSSIINKLLEFAIKNMEEK